MPVGELHCMLIDITSSIISSPSKQVKIIRFLSLVKLFKLLANRLQKTTFQQTAENSFALLVLGMMFVMVLSILCFMVIRRTLFVMLNKIMDPYLFLLDLIEKENKKKKKRKRRERETTLIQLIVKMCNYLNRAIDII